MKKKNLVLDFETMGVDPSTCAVVDCSVMIFDWDEFTQNPYGLKDISKTRRFKLNVQEQVKDYGYKIEDSVLEFWSKQSKEVRGRVKPTQQDLTVKEFVSNFHNLVVDENIGHWWTRGNAFDPVILTRLFDSQKRGNHLNTYLKYYMVRDMRTYIDAKFNFDTKNGFCPIADDKLWDKTFKAHDSSWDVLADVLRLQAIARAENDMEQI